MMTSGEQLKGLTTGLKCISGIDRAYILTNDKYAKDAQTLKEIAESIEIPTSIEFVKAYDYSDVVDTIFRIHGVEEQAHPGNTYSINATGGTKVMAMAACTASIYIGAKTYYVRERNYPEESDNDCLMLLETNTPMKLKGNNRTSIKILRYVEQATLNNRTITSSDIADHFDMKKQAVTYQIKKLREDKLIEVSDGVEIEPGHTDYRKKGIKLSPQGFTFVRHIIYMNEENQES